MGNRSRKVESHRIVHCGYMIVTRRDQRSNLWVSSVYKPIRREDPVSFDNRQKVHVGLLGKQRRVSAQTAAKEAVEKLPDMTPPKEEDKNDIELSQAGRPDGSKLSTDS